MATVVNCGCGAKLRMRSEQFENEVRCPKCNAKVALSLFGENEPQAKSSLANGLETLDESDPLGPTPDLLAPVMPESEMHPGGMQGPSLAPLGQHFAAANRMLGVDGEGADDESSRDPIQSDVIDWVIITFAGVGLLSITGWMMLTLLSAFMSFPDISTGSLISACVQFPVFISSVALCVCAVAKKLRKDWGRKIGIYVSVLFLFFILILLGLSVISMVNSQINAFSFAARMEDSYFGPSEFSRGLPARVMRGNISGVVIGVFRAILALAAPFLMLWFYRKR